MPSSRRRAPQLSAFVLAVMLLIPLTLSGHHHRAADATTKQSCAVCMVTSGYHAAPPSAALSLVAPIASGIVVAGPATRIATVAYRPFKAGRAPPTSPAARPA